MQKILSVLFISLFSVCSYAHAQEASPSLLASIKEQIEQGKSKEALKKLDKLMLDATALRITALTKLKKNKAALRAYEVLVQTRGQEVLPLLNQVAWAYTFKLLASPSEKSHQMLADYLGKLKDKKAVPGLTPLLKSKSFLTRLKAAEALGQIGDKTATSAIAPLLKDKNSLVATSAAWALGKLGDAKGTKYLQKCFKTLKRSKKLRCATLLARLKNKSVKRYLQKQLKTNSNRRARQVIVEGLSSLGSSSWGRTIAKDLKSSTEATRILAARTLGRFKIRRSRKGLRKLLKDRSIGVQIAAAQALGLMRSKKGSKILVAHLTNKKSMLRADAAKALGDVQDKKNQEALVKALQDPHLLVRVQTARALVQIGRQEGIGVLREAFVSANNPLKALAVQFALECSSKKGLKGKPLERTHGSLKPATLTSAFEEAAASDPENEGSELLAGSKKKAKAKGDKNGKTKTKPKARKAAAETEELEDW